jgi:hypothetical protein
LHAEDGLQFQLGARTVKSPARALTRLRALPGKLVGQGKGDLLAVRIAEHVGVQHDAAHARQLHAASLDMTEGRPGKFLPARGEFRLSLGFGALKKPTLRPVPVRTQHGWPLPVHYTRQGILGSVEAARDPEAGQAFEAHSFDRVVVPVHPTVHQGVQGRAGWVRPETERNLDVPF